MKMIDKLMEKRGYTKTEESKYGVYYQRIEPQKYTHIVCIIRKQSGKHIMQTYEEDTSCTVGLEIDELFILWLKAIYMKIKYHWKANEGASECRLSANRGAK